MMKLAEDYRAKAQRMRELALSAETPDQAQGYRDLAKTWEEMADIADQLQGPKPERSR